MENKGNYGLKDEKHLPFTSLLGEQKLIIFYVWKVVRRGVSQKEEAHWKQIRKGKGTTVKMCHGYEEINTLDRTQTVERV